MKSPNHGVPSGDRYIARLLVEALQYAKFEVELASELRSWEGQGDTGVQERIERDGQKEVKRLIEYYSSLSNAERPVAWFTYHLYHKAPDWIGPMVSEALSIPYFVAEASVAPKQAKGNWSKGYHSSIAALNQAQAVFSLNPNDLEYLTRLIQPNPGLVNLKPFLNISITKHNKQEIRQRIASKRNINENHYWLCTVAMMRKDSKLKSYLMLAESIKLVERKDWQLLIVGNGPAQSEVKFAFGDNSNVHFLGIQSKEYIEECLNASDIFLWPAINEAFGMSVLESLAAGLPVIAGRSGGISQIVDHQQTGILINDIDASKLAREIDDTLSQPSRISRMSAKSIDKYHTEHSLEIGAKTLQKEIMKYL
ncbi:MAG: glycosyltransferase [Gammaproteobacteria bacterium]|nr:glycosyltransferase [Gammaproteobacteria bacterium]